MAQEVGVAYVTLLPSGKGFGKAVEKQAGDGFAGAEKQSSTFFSKIRKGLKWAAVGVGAVATTVAGLAVKGGISRALNIEDAQAKLKGLGHDTKAIDVIMSNALASVKGTAFGLDAAATTAATAIAAGIQPGKELESYLRLTADAATIAGVSLDEMGAILNKTTTKGKVQLEELNQLQERNIPIIQYLADEYGVTADAMYDMVSRGEVDVARFRKAIEDNLGGAALAAGDTTRGAFANMQAAMSRFGEALVGEGLGAAQTFFTEVGLIFDGLTERVEPFVENIQTKLGDMFEIEGMGENFLAWLDETVDRIANGPIPQLLSALQPVLPALWELATVVGSALGDAFFQMGEALAPVLPLLAEALTDAVVELAPHIADLIEALLPLLPELVELIPPLVALVIQLLPLFIWAVEKLTPALIWAIEGVQGFLDVVDALFGFLQGDTTPEEFVSRVENMGGVMGSLIDIVNNVMGTIQEWAQKTVAKANEVRDTFTGLKDRVFEAFGGAGTWLVDTGRDMIQGLIDGVGSMIDSAVAKVNEVGGAMLGGIKSFLGIQSPSRLFRDEVGKMVGIGLLEGVGDTGIQAKIDRTVSHMVSVPDVPASGATGGVVQNNNFAHMDPLIAVQLGERRLERTLEGLG